MALKKKEKFPASNLAEANKMARDYDSYSVKIKELNSRKKELGDYLKSFAREEGVQDDKGSYYYDLDQYVVGCVARTSTSLDHEKAVSLLKKKGLGNCVKKVISYELNEAEIEKAVNCGDLTLEELHSVSNVKTTYAVSVNKKEVADTAQEVKFAARKK